MHRRAIGLVLDPAEAPVLTAHIAVVGKEDDHGVVCDPKRVQPVQDAAKVPVDVVDHAVVFGDEFPDLCFGLNLALWFGLMCSVALMTRSRIPAAQHLVHETVRAETPNHIEPAYDGMRLTLPD